MISMMTWIHEGSAHLRSVRPDFIRRPLLTSQPQSLWALSSLETRIATQHRGSLTPQCCVKSRNVQASNPSSQRCIFQRPMSLSRRSTGHSPTGHLYCFSTTLTKPASLIMFFMSGATARSFPNFWLASTASS